MNDLTIQDRVKRLYQRHFGPGHLIRDAQVALRSLEIECAALSPISDDEPLFEPLGNGLCRLNLRPLLQTGLSLKTACAMFVHTASQVSGDMAAFQADLHRIPRDTEELAWVDAYIAEGCPSQHHSDIYRAAFAPAYRVVLSAFQDAFDAFLRIDKMEKGIVSIDGPCASGKSTLAALLGAIFHANVFHVDDFFLRPEQRTPERLAEPGGNMDRERLLREVLLPLHAGEDVTFQPYNCAVQVLEPPVTIPYAPVSIVEGVYGQHPLLRDLYTLKLFTQVKPDTQLARLLARNGEAYLRRFIAEWIPMENAYFDAFHVAEGCDLVLPAS